MKRLIFSMLSFLGSAVLLAPDVAGNDDEHAKLGGDWCGLRPQWAARGVNFEAVYTSDFFSNRRGGIKRGDVYLDNVDLLRTLDGAATPVPILL